MAVLPRAFYSRPALEVARNLLGCHLVRIQNGQRLAGLITETEAYQGEDDLGCHASAGKTPRTSVMYGPPGHAYIYFTYGMHWLINAVTSAEGVPAAVLIRAIHPVEGKAQMALNRPYHAQQRNWTNGPAKLTQAFSLDGSLNGHDLRESGSELFLAEALVVPQHKIKASPRIGLGNTPEPWLSLPWRFWVAGNRYVSRGSGKLG